jgi:hypothetical protein
MEFMEGDLAVLGKLKYSAVDLSRYAFRSTLRCRRPALGFVTAGWALTLAAAQMLRIRTERII